MKPLSALLFSTLSFSTLFAQQKQAPTPPLQTPRQAFIEMITGGQKAITKHLTVEVQQVLAKAGARSAAALMELGSVPGQFGSDTQTFESGPLLMVINQPRSHSKVELRVDNDDLSGDEDTIELSLHVNRENNDQDPEDWEAFLSHLTVNMKKQTGIWRLNRVGIGVEIAIGDPEFVKNTFLKEPKKPANVTASVNAEQENEKPEIHRPPDQLVTTVAMAEFFFARQHPDTGFTCSLPDLAEATKSFGLDQIVMGTDGYKVSLSGCQGHPVGSFQVVAEPMAGNAGKAYCTDATHNVRIADDGRGSTCLSSGNVNQPREVDDVMTGLRVVDPNQPKP